MTLSLDERPRAYTPVSQWLHWLIVALLIVQFAVAWTMPDIHRGTVPDDLISWHLSIGLAILLIMLVRLIWRETHQTPPPPNDLPRPLQLLSRATHYAFYAILIVLPLLGWANASARGWQVKLFGAIPLPPLSQTGSKLGLQLGDLHQLLATALLALVALHVVGALYHALFLRDRVVNRINPLSRA